MFQGHLFISCRRLECPGHDPFLVDESRADLESSGQRMLLCRTCGQPIASPRDRIEVGGRHIHALFNPTGILFEVGCFAQAGGCGFGGDPTLAFTWFAGYAWRFAFCRQCSVQLGWEYQSRSDRFVGLIMTELRES